MFCSRCGTQTRDDAKFCPACGLDITGTGVAGAQASPEPTEQREIDVVREALKSEYEIVKELGRGGMAIVFQARDLQLDRDVAVKVLPFSLSYDKEFVERFQREARTAAKLEHPNIIPIYRVGKSGRVIYFVMKFLKGKSLADLIEISGPMPVEDIRQLLVETASALGYAHKHGIIHRDIKPDNILYDDTGRSMLTDFGIAKAASGTRLTGTGMAIGTPHYMSPEQARAQSVDGRTDIYSLGVVAYQCLTGKVPFDGEDAFSIGYKHIMEEVPEPDLDAPEQTEFFQIVRRMLAKKADDRFQSSDELIQALEELGPGPARYRTVGSQPTTPLPRTPIPEDQTDRAAAIAATPTTPMPKASPPAPAAKKKKRSGVLVGVLAILLVGGGGGGYFYYTNYLAGNSGQPSELPETDPGAGLALGADSGSLAASADSASLSPESAQVDSLASDSLRDTTATPLAELPMTGVLLVAGVPSGGRVKVDNGEFQREPQFEVSPGSHRVEVRATGYESFSQSIAVARGDTVTLAVEMAREAAPPPKPAGPTLAEICAAGPSNPNFDATRCFDDPPATTDLTTVTLPEGFQGSPQPLLMWVLVSTDGQAVRAIPASSEDPEFASLAIQRALSLSYQPARRRGRPVQAWIQIPFYPAPQ